MPGEILVEPNETRRSNWRRPVTHEKSIRQARVTVVERELPEFLGKYIHRLHLTSQAS